MASTFLKKILYNNPNKYKLYCIIDSSANLSFRFDCGQIYGISWSTFRASSVKLSLGWIASKCWCNRILFQFNFVYNASSDGERIVIKVSASRYGMPYIALLDRNFLIRCYCLLLIDTFLLHCGFHSKLIRYHRGVLENIACTNNIWV